MLPVTVASLQDGLSWPSSMQVRPQELKLFPEISADDILIVAEPDLANMRNTKNLMSMLKSARPNDRPPLYCINQVGMHKRPEIELRAFAKTIETQPIATIPFDSKIFGEAANNGQMIVEVAAKHRAARMFQQMARERHPVPAWIVVGAGTGGTSATIGRYVRYRCHDTQVAVADPEGSVFGAYFRTGDAALTAPGSRIEGIGRPRVEPSFVRTLVDRMFEVPNLDSVAAMRVLSALPGVTRLEPRRFLAPGRSGAAEGSSVQLLLQTSAPVDSLGATLGRSPLTGLRLQVMPVNEGELRVLSAPEGAVPSAVQPADGAEASDSEKQVSPQ